ncbi:hypothetical protein NECID01_0468 [Nematocida sp. AWRm77]|nr:hypothetical protein NECID01_0468 [Nematocida sp. AWRm77]
MGCPTQNEPGDVLRRIIEVYSEEKSVTISKEQQDMLVEYLLPYTKLSFNVPTEMEVQTLASGLERTARERVEEMLADGTAETRKALYFLLKIQDKLQSKKILPRVRVDPETEAHKAAKSAAIGVYLSWFRELAEGRGNALKQRVDPGLFDICYTVYTAGEAYLYLAGKPGKEESEDAKVFQEVVKKHVRQYRSEIYGEDTADLFDFVVKNGARMKWIARVCHLAQTFLSLESTENSAGCIMGFVKSLQGSPWTEGLAEELLEEYKEPLWGHVVRWIKGDPPVSLFIKEMPGRLWSRYILMEEDIPPGISTETGRQLVYLGKANRFLGMLAKKTVGEAALEAPDIFNKEAVEAEYRKGQSLIKERFFDKFQIVEHLERVRDIFFLFREDFFHDLVHSFSSVKYADEAPLAVDEALERCFGRGIEQSIDVIVQSPHVFRLVYKPVFPYSVITETVAETLGEGFEFFWKLRKAIHTVTGLYQGAGDRAAFFPLVSTAKNIEYHYFERIVKELWRFDTLAESTLYDPEKLSKTVEDIAHYLVSACTESCTISVLDAIISTDVQNPTPAHLKDLLQRISYEE